MAGLTLVIGNKNYSSWSMRPWVLMKQLAIPFEEKKLRFHTTEWDAEIERWSPSRLVRGVFIAVVHGESDKNDDQRFW